MFLTGIPGIDSQHEELFAKAYSILDNAKDGKLTSELAYRLIQDMIVSFKNHCATEEHLLDMIGLPDALVHKEMHKNLYNRFYRELNINKNIKKIDLTHFTKHILNDFLTHIEVFDKEYANHITKLVEIRTKFNITGLKARLLVS